MTIDYEQLRSLVKEAMFTGGGINEPSNPEGIPHRQPAADPPQEKGDPAANALYDIALTAREATEQLVAALEDPTFDDAYEFAFKASACLRKALNSLEGMGAHPDPEDRVVAPPSYSQKYNAGGGDYSGGGMLGYVAGLGGFEESMDPQGRRVVEAAEVPGTEEEEEGVEVKTLGVGTQTQQQQAKEKKIAGQEIAAGEKLGKVDPKERNMLQQLEKIQTHIAEKGDLTVFRSYFINSLKPIIAKVEAQSKADTQMEQKKRGGGK